MKTIVFILVVAAIGVTEGWWNTDQVLKVGAKAGEVAIVVVQDVADIFTSDATVKASPSASASASPSATATK